jgi:hypothetical protein
MCPLCLTSLAITLTMTTGIGAAAVAAATRIAKSLAPGGPNDANDESAPAADRIQEMRGER